MDACIFFWFIAIFSDKAIDKLRMCSGISFTYFKSVLLCLVCASLPVMYVHVLLDTAVINLYGVLPPFCFNLGVVCHSALTVPSPKFIKLFFMGQKSVKSQKLSAESWEIYRQLLTRGGVTHGSSRRLTSEAHSRSHEHATWIPVKNIKSTSSNSHGNRQPIRGWKQLGTWLN